MRLLLLLALTVMLGCKKSSPTNNNGPEASLQDIQKSQDEVLSVASPLEIESGEFAYFLKTQEVYSSQEPAKTLMEEEGITVTDREDYPDYFNVTYVREVINHIEEGSPNYKFKGVFSIGKPERQDKVFSHNQLFPLLDEAQKATGTDSFSVSFHNLKVEDIKVEKPKKVLEREPCPEEIDCRLNAKKLSYDIVFSETGKTSEKTHIEILVSPDVPFFAAVLQSCLSTVISIDTARPLVKQCKTINDYLHSQP